MENKNISKNKRLFINLSSSIVALSASLIINFFLSPYIVKTLGVEANGFITLANNFISYASLASIALNSMAGRFITIKVHQNDFETANKYYTSVTLGNFILAICLLIPSLACVIYLEHIINIPVKIVWDVRFLFALIFLNYLISTAFSSWQTATFITNRLYLQSIRNMQSQILKVVVILGLFSLLKPSVYYMGVATLAATLFKTLYSLYYKQKLVPNIRIRKKDFEIRALFELIASGFWNTVTYAGQLLLSGLDLLIANLFIGPIEMGMLSLAKTLPSVIIQLAGTISSVFVPTFTIDYAKGDIIGLKKELKKGMKLTGTILTIPLAILIVFGDKFYQLWVPSQNSRVLQIMSILTCFGLIFTSGIQCLYNIFSVVNKLKTASLLMLLSGFVNAGVVFILLKTTNLGIYAVAGVSSCINLARNMFFVVPFGAKYLKLKWNTFIPEVVNSVISVALSVLVGYGIKLLFVLGSWSTLIIAAGITALISLFVNIMITLNKDERKYLFSFLLAKFKI